MHPTQIQLCQCFTIFFSIQGKTLLVLLDCEEAFDKITHDQRIEALHRMNRPNKMINRITLFYKPHIVACRCKETPQNGKHEVRE